MRKTVLKESDYNDFYKTVLYGKIEDEIDTAVRTAYRDLCRTIRGFSKHKRHDEIFGNCAQIVYDYIKKINSYSSFTQNQFDFLHKLTCDRLITFFEDQEFTYGQAQKWINMSLKYVSMFNHRMTEKYYEYCHVPIDNYILKSTNYKQFDTAWSKIASYEKYDEFQKWFRNNYEGIPLDNEFRMWLNEK